VVIAVILVILNGGSDDKTKTSAGAGANVPRIRRTRRTPGRADGWPLVLASGLQNPTASIRAAGFTSPGTKPPGWVVTLDSRRPPIDISGDKITGGTYTTGITGANGDPCQTLSSKVDLKPSAVSIRR